MYVLVDEATGDGIVVTLWEPPASKEANRPATGKRFVTLGDIITASSQPSALFTVMAEG